MLRFMLMSLIAAACFASTAGAAPSLEELREGLTFYAPFDDPDLAAWHAVGERHELSGGKGTQVVEGMIGSGVVVPKKQHVTYTTRGNLDGMSATISLWIKPDVEYLTRVSNWHKEHNNKFWSQRFVTTSWSTEGRVYLDFRRGRPFQVGFYDWHPTGPEGGPYSQVEPDKLGGWHHLVVQWGDGRKLLFWDGELVDEFKGATGWRLGTRISIDDTVEDSVYDEMMFWNRMLSAREVEAVYRLGRAGKRLIEARAPEPAMAATEFPPAGTNLLRNADFEMGLSGWELLYPALEESDAIVQDGVDGSEQAVRIHPRATSGRDDGEPRLVQGPFHVRGGRPYTLTVYAKSNRSNAYADMFLARVQNSTGKWPDLRKKVKLTDQWQKIEFTGMTVGEADCLAYFGVEFTGGGDGVWVIDRVSVVEGDGDGDPQPHRSVEFALATDKLGHIFRKGDAVTFDLRAWKTAREPGAPAGTSALTLSVEDFNDEVVYETDVQVRPMLGRVTKQPLTLPLERFGPMRAVLREGDEVVDELNFTVIPFTHEESDTLGQFLGGELNPNDWACATAHALGVRWGFGLDVSGATSWDRVEAERGKYDWSREDDIACYRKWGLNVLGLLDRAPKWAAATKAWKSVPAVEHADAWEEYAYRTVDHYKEDIHHWLVWDEMDVAMDKRGGNVELYMNLVARAYRAAHKADPDTKVLAPSSTGNPKWVQALIDRGVLEYADVWSMDFWSNRYDRIQRLGEMGRSDGKERLFWDHGTGGSARTFYRYLFPEPDNTQDTVPTYRDATVTLAKLLIDRRAAGIDKMFYYWIVKQQITPSHAAISFFEFDGSIRPMAAAFSILGQYLYQYEPIGKLNAPDSLTGFLFQAKSDGAPMAVLYGDREGFISDETHELRDKDMSARMAGNPRGVFIRLDTSLRPNQYVVRDMMLNPTTRGVVDDDRLSIWVGETPIVIEGKSLSAKEFAKALGHRD